MPSLEIIASAVHREREAQLRHFESLDTKAGIVLGFGGVLVALGTRAGSPFALAGELTAAAGALSALVAFFPRMYPVLELRRLRDRYLQSGSEFAQIHLVDTHVVMVESASRLLRWKARWLEGAASLLAGATGLLSLDSLIA